MNTMTIRGLDDLTINALKEKAKKEGWSVNAALVKMIQEALGIKKKKRTIIHNDLDYLAGTWSDKDDQEFLEATAEISIPFMGRAGWGWGFLALSPLSVRLGMGSEVA
jgi:hypothetical protein